MQHQDLIAVVDLGSNSFHMALASIGGSGIRIVDRVKHKVYLASGLSADMMLDQAAIDRGVDAMRLFAQRLKNESLWKVRIVATHTLRVAKNAEHAIAQFREVFDHPVDIIEGIEEARLIYTAVAHTTPHVESSRFVIDIGGGSTELVVGDGFKPKLRSSHSLGSNLFSKRFFADGKLTKERFDSAVARVESILEIYYRSYVNAGWQVVIGTSGTIKHISSIVAQQQSSVVTYSGLLALRDQMIDAQVIDACHYEGVPDDRVKILPGGLAVLIGIFELFEIEELHYEDAGLREGVIYQELWHLEHPDIRERSVNDLKERHKVDVLQCARVQATALTIYDQLADKYRSDEYRKLLDWAAQLHEVGRTIRVQDVQDHSKYIVRHSPMPGFTVEQQKILAWLVGNHRKGIDVEKINTFTQHDPQMLVWLLMALRIAVTLHRSRGEIDCIPEATAEFVDAVPQLTIGLAQAWLKTHSLSDYDLAEEAKRWQKRGWALQLEPLA